MAELVWDGSDAGKYESGLSKGVFYPLHQPGVVWDGLISINDSIVGGELTDRYFDGFKYLIEGGNRNYQATISAYSAPQDFWDYSGYGHLGPGVNLGKQPKKNFNLTYQTNVGDDGYKIHLIYNCIATPLDRTSMTLSNTVSPNILQWKIDAVPASVPGFYPSAHLVLDSSMASSSVLQAVEERLYGTEDEAPDFPTVVELLALYGVV